MKTWAHVIAPVNRANPLPISFELTDLFVRPFGPQNLGGREFLGKSFTGCAQGFGDVLIVANDNAPNPDYRDAFSYDFYEFQPEKSRALGLTEGQTYLGVMAAFSAIIFEDVHAGLRLHCPPAVAQQVRGYFEQGRVAGMLSMYSEVAFNAEHDERFRIQLAEREFGVNLYAANPQPDPMRGDLLNQNRQYRRRQERDRRRAH